MWVCFLYTVNSMDLGVGLVRVSSKGHHSVPLSSRLKKELVSSETVSKKQFSQCFMNYLSFHMRSL